MKDNISMDGDSGLNIKEVEGRRSQGLLHFLTIITDKLTVILRCLHLDNVHHRLYTC